MQVFTDVLVRYFLTKPENRVSVILSDWTSSEAVRCKSLSDQCETRCQNNGCKVGICLFESCNCLGCNKRSLGDSMFQRKKYEDMYSDNVQRREENKELNGDTFDC